MKDNTNKALKLGVFVAVAILLFVVAVWLIGSKNNYFNPSITIHTSFRDIRGLIEGNNVRFAGINVGSVKKITLVSDSAVMLDLTVSKDYAKFIYRNSVAEIGQEGLVGNKLVTISSGTPESGLIENGSYLKARKSIDYDKMLQESQDILTLIRDAASDLKSVAQKIDEGKGDLGKLVNENTITTGINSSISKLNTALTNIDRISKKLHDGQGVFQGLPDPLTVARYHSLVVAREGLPDCLETCATSPEGEIMALRHRSHPVVGVQFHPEAVLTVGGHQLLASFLAGRIR